MVARQVVWANAVEPLTAVAARASTRAAVMGRVARALARAIPVTRVWHVIRAQRTTLGTFVVPTAPMANPAARAQHVLVRMPATLAFALPTVAQAGPILLFVD